MKTITLLAGLLLAATVGFAAEPPKAAKPSDAENFGALTGSIKVLRPGEELTLTPTFLTLRDGTRRLLVYWAAVEEIVGGPGESPDLRVVKHVRFDGVDPDGDVAFVHLTNTGKEIKPFVVLGSDAPFLEGCVPERIAPPKPAKKGGRGERAIVIATPER